MSESASFTPRPRVARRHAPSFDAENFLRELDIIAHRIERVAAVPAEAFSADCPEYDSACMVIIRLAAFLEREEYASYHGYPNLLREARLANNSQHRGALGVPSMDDQLLWTAVTRNVPDMIARLRAAASRG